MCPCSHRGAKTREENTITGGQEATLLAWHQPLSPQPSLQPRHAYSGKSETSPRVQPYALRPRPGLNQGRDNHHTQEKPNSVRIPCLPPWALNPPPKVDEHKRGAYSHLTLTQASPTPAIPHTKVMAASTHGEKMQPMLTSDPALLLKPLGTQRMPKDASRPG